MPALSAVCLLPDRGPTPRPLPRPWSAAVYSYLLAQSWRADTIALMFSSTGWPQAQRTQPPPAAAHRALRIASCETLNPKPYALNPCGRQLTNIAEMFLRPASAAAFWLHLLCLDLFVGRREPASNPPGPEPPDAAAAEAAP